MRRASRWPCCWKRGALICPENGHSLSVEELAAIAAELASRLAGLGVARGDCVALVLDDGPELIESLFALAPLAPAAAPLNPAYTTPEFASTSRI